MGFLEIIGIIVTSAACVSVAALCVRAAARAVSRARGGQAVRHTPREVTEEIRSQSLRYEDERRRWARLFKQRYDSVRRTFALPPNAKVVVKCASAFSLEHVPLEHYAWRQGDALYFFPGWSGIAARLSDPEYVHVYASGDLERLYGWKIPVAGIEDFWEDPDRRLTFLQCRDSHGKRYLAVLLEGGGELLRGVCPDRDRAAIERRSYLSSYSNLDDIRAAMDELSAGLESGLLSAEQYEEGKKRVLSKL
jgi:hypothetical protein